LISFIRFRSRINWHFCSNCCSDSSIFIYSLFIILLFLRIWFRNLSMTEESSSGRTRKQIHILLCKSCILLLYFLIFTFLALLHYRWSSSRYRWQVRTSNFFTAFYKLSDNITEFLGNQKESINVALLVT